MSTKDAFHRRSHFLSSYIFSRTCKTCSAYYLFTQQIRFDEYYLLIYIFHSKQFWCPSNQYILFKIHIRIHSTAGSLCKRHLAGHWGSNRESWGCLFVLSATLSSLYTKRIKYCSLFTFEYKDYQGVFKR